MQQWTKYLRQEDVHYYFDEETIMVSSASYFRNMERPIGDRNEGRTEHKIKSIEADSSTESGRQVIQKLAEDMNMFQFDGPMPRNLKINITNGCNGFSENFHMFCVSDGSTFKDYKKIRNQMRDEGMEPYNAALRITDLHGLRRHIAAHGLVQNTRLPITEAFNNIYVAKVEYGRTESFFGEGEIIKPRPNLKNKYYKCQKEWRIVFETTHKTEDRLSVYVPGLKAFFKVVKFK